MKSFLRLRCSVVFNMVQGPEVPFSHLRMCIPGCTHLQACPIISAAVQMMRITHQWRVGDTAPRRCLQLQRNPKHSALPLSLNLKHSTLAIYPTLDTRLPNSASSPPRITKSVPCLHLLFSPQPTSQSNSRSRAPPYIRRDLNRRRWMMMKIIGG